MISFKEIFFPDESCCLDATAKIIYADESETIINQYIYYCTVINQQIKKYGLTLNAIKNTIRICKDNNMLKKYLERRETEVEGIMLTLFDQDRMTELWKKELTKELRAKCLAEGRAEGKTEGRAEGRAEVIISMLLNKMKPEQIAKIVNMTVEQIVDIGKKAAVL